MGLINNKKKFKKFENLKLLLGGSKYAGSTFIIIIIYYNMLMQSTVEYKDKLRTMGRRPVSTQPEFNL